MPPGRRLLFVPALVAALGACRETSPSLGETPGRAQHHVGEALGALGSRFGPIEREPAFEALRPKLLRASLVPSRVFDDDSAWTDRDGETRGLGFTGFRAEGRYRVGVKSRPAPPTGPADYRGWLSLRRLGPGEFEWSSAEQLGLGALPVDGLADAVSQVFRDAEAAGEGDLRPGLRRLLPRTAEALGRGLALEALRLERDAAGATAVFAAVRLDLDSLAMGFPRYASFLGEYALPIRLRVQLDGGGSGAFCTLEGQEGRFTLRARIHDGHLVPLEGHARPLPERARLRIDLTSKAGLFRYGVHDLEADVRLVGRPGEKSLEAVFGREPGWVIPFLVKPLLRVSLRRPFEGEGAFLAYALRENGSGLTLVSRDYRVAVKESWLVSWMGANTGEVVASFRASAEAEADRFSAEALAALRADLVRLLGGG